jgi:Leucine-rich repeat (LRR) protein
VASQLTQLVLSSPLVEHVSFIRACKQLEVLDLSGCMQLESLAPLSACTKLLELHLRGCQSVKDLAPISTCVNLRELSLGRWKDEEDRGCGTTGTVTAVGCPIGTVEQALDLLLPLTQLVALEIDCDGFVSLEGLEGSALNQLQSLSLTVSDWQLQAGPRPLDLSVLSSLRGLTKLGLAGFKEDLSWLPSCTSLEVLDVRGTTIDSFETVRSCSTLRQIWLKEYVNLDRMIHDSRFVPLWDTDFTPLTGGGERRWMDVLWMRHASGSDVDDEDEDGAGDSGSSDDDAD